MWQFFGNGSKDGLHDDVSMEQPSNPGTEPIDPTEPIKTASVWEEWSAWASEHSTILLGVAAATTAIVASFTVRSFYKQN